VICYVYLLDANTTAHYVNDKLDWN